MRAGGERSLTLALLAIADRTLEIATDDPLVDAYLTRAYARLLTTDAAARARADAFDAARIDTTPSDAADVRLRAAITGSAALCAQAFRASQRFRALYCTTVTHGDATVALAGPRGCGKTTLALALLRRGWRTLGDEFALLERGTPLAHPFPLAFSVREPALAALRDPALDAACAATPFVLEGDGVRAFHGIDVEAVYGPGTFAPARPITHLVLIGPARQVAAIEALPSSVAALELLPHLFVARFSADDMWEMLEWFARVDCSRLRAPGPHEAADAIASLIETKTCTSTPAR